MEEVKKRWYVVRSISGKEKRVKEYLEMEVSRLKLDQFIGQVLIPTEKVFQIRNGKKVNYIFTSIPFPKVSPLRSVLSTPNNKISVS